MMLLEERTSFTEAMMLLVARMPNGFNLNCCIESPAMKFENYAIVAMQSDNITFNACKIIKGTSGFNLKIFFSPGGANIQIS